MPFLKVMNREFLQFIWAQAHPQFLYNYLTIPKIHGITAFPGPLKYCQATHLARVFAGLETLIRNSGSPCKPPLGKDETY